MQSRNTTAKHRLTLSMMILVGCGFLGCGQGSVVEEQQALDAQAAYDAGLAAFAEGNLAQARSHFDGALTGSGLPVDCLVDAQLKRSMCAAANGDFEAAQSDLDEAAQGVMDEAQLHVARGFLLAKQGKQTEADAEFSKAKQINPRVEIPSL